MAAVRLYPTLSSFYKDKNIGFGSELDNHIILCGVPEEKLYRKDVNSSKNLKHKKEDTNKVERALYPRLPSNDNNSEVDNERWQPQDTTHPRRAEPSAPPIDILDEDILRFLEDVIAEQQNLSSPDAGTPAIDYSTLNIPTDIVLDDSWIDDLQPDYDVTVEEIAADVLNNLNVEHARDAKTHKEKSFSLGDNLAQSKDNHIAPKSRTRDPSPSKDHAKHHKRHNHDINGNNIPTSAQQHHEKMHSKQHRHHSPVNRNSRSPTRRDTRAQAESSRNPHESRSGHPYAHKDRQTHISKETHAHLHKDPHAKIHKEAHNASKDAHRHVSKAEHIHVNPDAPGNRPSHVNKGERRHAVKRDAEREKDNTASPLEMSRPERPVSPGSPEYNDWMKWRKQVNRQLATVILLRRGGQVHVQRNDMTRKPLNQRSIDFVSQIARSGNITSLGGKPYVMYGIPRATLSGSQGDLMY